MNAPSRAVVSIPLVLALSTSAEAEGGIRWSKGGLDRALSSARATSRPLFVYWGAKWCPPCNQVKRRLFSDPRFQRALRPFIAVYLDGDSDGAQRWGERLKASGYPTMIVLSSGGKELSRLPTGIPIERAVALLNGLAKAAKAANTTGALKRGERTRGRAAFSEALQRARRGRASRADWQALAFYDWARPQLARVLGDAPSVVLRQLSLAAPAKLVVERDRLFLAHLALRLRQTKRRQLAPGVVQRAHRRLTGVLGVRRRLIGSLEPMQVDARTIVDGLYPNKGDRGRSALVAAWKRAMTRLARDPGLTPRERLAAFVPIIELAPGTARDPALRHAVQRAVALETKRARRRSGRQAIITLAAHLLTQVGDNPGATRLLQRELKRSPSAFYLMSSLAALARERGDKREALRWLSRAYRAARGRATRFQWGVQWIEGLTTIAPDALRQIKRASRLVVAELLRFDDAMFGRNIDRLQQLRRAYTRWARRPERRAALEGLVARWREMCRQRRTGRTARARCQEFFGALADAD